MIITSEPESLIILVKVGGLFGMAHLEANHGLGALEANSDQQTNSRICKVV